MSELKSRKEYLKRYLDGHKKSKKKKLKSKNSHNQSRFKIVDEDIDLKKIEISNIDDDEVGDEAPFIVDVIDERPDHVKLRESYSRTRWKKLGSPPTGGEPSSSSYPEPEDNSEFKKHSSTQMNRNKQDIQLKLQEKQSSPDSVFKLDATDRNASKIAVSHSTEHLSHKSTHSNSAKVAYPLKEQVKDKLHSKKPVETSLNNHRIKSEHDSDVNLSPSKKSSEEDEEVVKRKHNSDDDMSPPRGRTVKLSSTVVWKSSESENMPMLQRDVDSDISPPRIRNSDMSDSDISPPRSKTDSHHKQRHFTPLEKKRKHSSKSSSVSPHKKSRSKVQHNSDSYNSPLQGRTASGVGKKLDSDNGIQIKKSEAQCYGSSKSSHHSSPSLEKLCVERRRHDSDADSSLSPSRGRSPDSPEKQKAPFSHTENSHSTIHKGKSQRKEEKSLQENLPSGGSDLKRKLLASTLSGMKTGLQDSATLREETRKFKWREQVAVNELSDDLSGRNAETILRDKDTGRRRNLKKEELKLKEEEKKNAEKQEKYMEWGKGLKQKDDQQKKCQEDLYEMSKPLNRYAGDEDLERDLKNELRGGDPMLEYIKKRRQKGQTITSNLPVYQGPPAPPNRFNISPGYRWDGVDRSNGFEKKFFEKINSTKAAEHEAYLWSIENM